jgi:acetate kinase
LKDLCNKKSGLLGISGVSNDVRNLMKLAGQGDSRAQLAIDIFCYRIKKYIGVYCAVLDTVDAVVFTGGIGENAVFLRQQICTGLTQLGIQLDEETNKTVVAKEAEINTKNSKVKLFVIPANEQVAIANDTYELTSRKLPIVSKPNKHNSAARRQMEILQEQEEV